MSARWARETTPTGVPVYRCGDWKIEANVRLSTHVGMVFGNYANEAGRQSRIVGWRPYAPDGRALAEYRTLAEAKAAVARRIEAA